MKSIHHLGTSTENNGTIVTLCFGGAEIPLSSSDALRFTNALEAVIAGSRPQTIHTSDGAAHKIETTERGEVMLASRYDRLIPMKDARGILGSLKAGRACFIETSKTRIGALNKEARPEGRASKVYQT